MPDLTLTSAALLIFIICIGFVLLRGAIRLLIGVLVICASAWVGFQVWQIAPSLSIEYLGSSIDWLTTGAAIAAFVVTFIILRLIANFITRPLGAPKSGSRGPAAVALLLLFALIPTGLLWTIGGTLIHHFGSIAEIRASAASEDKPESTVSATSRRWKESLAAWIPAEWFLKLDPLADPSRLSLAKFIAEPQRPPVIDPTTGKPYPRAIIVRDPELQTLADDRRYDVLLRHPLFQKALDDPKVQQALRDSMR